MSDKIEEYEEDNDMWEDYGENKYEEEKEDEDDTKRKIPETS